MDSNELIVAAGQAASTMAKDEELLRLFYKDFGQPGVKQVGKALSTVLGLGNTVLLPFKMVNEKANALYNHHMEQFRKKMEQIPEEKIIGAAPEIGVPILENLEKTTNESISQMYINLLANASHIDLAKNAHPRFVSVIEALTQDEAIILQQKHSFLTITVNSHVRLQTSAGIINGTTKPVVRGTVYHKPGILQFPENASFYFDNLCSLGLLEASTFRPLVTPGQDAYSHLKELFAKEMKVTGPGESIEVVEASYRPTEFGIYFSKACRHE